MTLVVAVTSKESIWIMTDRRLSYEGRPPIDDARKILNLESGSDIALIGYAGLGATAHGTEPSTWMGAVLRGRRAPLVTLLQILANAVQRQIPSHLISLPGALPRAHFIVIPALIDGKPQLFSIDLVLNMHADRQAFRFTRWQTGKNNRTPRFMASGSGAVGFLNSGNARKLISLINAHDQNRISARSVARRMASMNVAISNTNESVGPRSIVAWRYPKQGRKRGGGGHAMFNGDAQENLTDAIPTISGGYDVAAITTVMWHDMISSLKTHGIGSMRLGLSKEADEAIRSLPDTPDDSLC